jgi:adenylate kinase
MNRRTFLAGVTAPLVAQKAPTGPRRVLILLGPPGAGKTTHAKILKTRFDVPAISAAELLKQSHGRKDGMSKALKGQIEGGALLNDEGVNQLVLARISRGDCFNGFILDGYPTTPSQAEFLSAQLAELTFPEPVVVLLEISDQLVRERLRRRGRADDTPANIERRLAEYRNEEAAVLAKYKRVIRVDSSGDEKTVAVELNKALDRYGKMEPTWATRAEP